MPDQTPEPITEQQLDAIEQRAAAATPGPWTVELEQCDCSDGYCHHGTYVSAIYAADGERRTEIGDFPDADWQFAIHARTDVPALLDEVRRQRSLLADLADRWVDLADQGDVAIGHFEGPAAAVLDAEVGERGRTYRKAASDVRVAVAEGRLPRDLLTATERAAAVPVAGGADQ